MHVFFYNLFFLFYCELIFDESFVTFSCEYVLTFALNAVKILSFETLYKLCIFLFLVDTNQMKN